jgi:hypothetical protein
MVEFLEREIEQLHDSIATLDRESTAHTRRCAEMQLEIDVLKKTVTGLTR